jgi:hypothetical protein
MKKKPTMTRNPLTDDELRSLTADEYFALKLSEDERRRFRAINDERERDRIRSAKANQAETAQLLSELQAASIGIEDVGELVTRAEPYPEAIPVLLRHLVLPYSDDIKSTIARSLAVPEPLVRSAWPILVSEYKNAKMGRGLKSPGDTEEFELGAKDALACTLAAAVTDETLEEFIEIAKDRSHGDSRLLLLSALRQSKNPLAKLAIEELASDPQLRIEIASWKRR